MNIFNIANRGISLLNRNIKGILKRNIGYTTRADGSVMPLYTEEAISLQIQSCEGRDLQYLDGINLQGIFKTVCTESRLSGVVRADGTGGDILLIPENGINQSWKVLRISENWAKWTTAIIWQQI